MSPSPVPLALGIPRRDKPGPRQDGLPGVSSPPHPAGLSPAGVLCEPCDSYGDGHTAGKQAAHFEIRMWELGGYAPVSAHTTSACRTRRR